MEEWTSTLGVGWFEAYSVIDSTNNRARSVALGPMCGSALIVADRQTEGRGRRGRPWYSDTPEGLWFTAVRCEAPERGCGVALRAGLAVATGMEELVPGLQVQVKWPNDLWVSGRKVGGVLCERVGAALLIGVGLNLNQRRDDLPRGLDPPASSVRRESGVTLAKGWALEAMAPRILEIAPMPRGRIPRGELEALEARSPLRGRKLRVDGVALGPDGETVRIASTDSRGGAIAPDGSLEVVAPSGRSAWLVAGSVGLTVRSGQLVRDKGVA